MSVARDQSTLLDISRANFRFTRHDNALTYKSVIENHIQQNPDARDSLSWYLGHRLPADPAQLQLFTTTCGLENTSLCLGNAGLAFLSNSSPADTNWSPELVHLQCTSATARYFNRNKIDQGASLPVVFGLKHENGSGSVPTFAILSCVNDEFFFSVNPAISLGLKYGITCPETQTFPVNLPLHRIAWLVPAYIIIDYIAQHLVTSGINTVEDMRRTNQRLQDELDNAQTTIRNLRAANNNNNNNDAAEIQRIIDMNQDQERQIAQLRQQIAEMRDEADERDASPPARHHHNVTFNDDFNNNNNRGNNNNNNIAFKDELRDLDAIIAEIAHGGTVVPPHWRDLRYIISMNGQAIEAAVRARVTREATRVNAQPRWTDEWLHIFELWVKAASGAAGSMSRLGWIASPLRTLGDKISTMLMAHLAKKSPHEIHSIIQKHIPTASPFGEEEAKATSAINAVIDSSASTGSSKRRAQSRGRSNGRRASSAKKRSSSAGSDKPSGNDSQGQKALKNRQ